MPFRLFGALLACCALAALTSCAAAPVQRIPAQGAAALDPETIPYDNIDFRTNRESPIKPGCSGVSTRVLTTAGISDEPQPTYSDPPGCMIRDGSAQIAYRVLVPKASFDAYWNGRDRERLWGYNYFHRGILEHNYYYVSHVSKAYSNERCQLAVSTGSPRTLVIKADTLVDVADDEKFPLERARGQLCAEARKLATALLASADPHGGSMMR